MCIDGTFWYSSDGGLRLTQAFHGLAREAGMPISMIPEVAYAKEICRGVYYPLTASAQLENGELVPTIGESSGGYVAKMTPGSLYVVNETPPFLATQAEDTPGDREIARAEGRIERVVSVGMAVLAAYKDAPLAGLALAHYETLQYRSDYWQRVFAGQATPIKETIQLSGPTAELFRATRHLADAFRIATLLHDRETQANVSNVIQDTVNTVREALAPRTLAIREMVSIQVGTFALACMRKSGRL